MEDAFRCATRWIKDGRDFGNAGLYAANNQCILVCSLGVCTGGYTEINVMRRTYLRPLRTGCPRKLIEVRARTDRASSDLGSRWISMTFGDKPRNGRSSKSSSFYDVTRTRDDCRGCSPRDSDRGVEQVDNVLRDLEV